MLRPAVIAFSLAVIMTSTSWARIGGGDVVFQVKDAKKVVYSHDDHVTKFRLRCTECHHRLYAMAMTQQRSDMADMKSGKSCGACHNAQRAFGIAGNCERCHNK